MKKWGTCLTVVLLFFWLALPVRAEEDYTRELAETLGTDRLADYLEDDAKELLNQAGISGPGEADRGGELLAVFSGLLREKLLGPLHALAAVTALAILCRLARSLAGEALRETLSLAGTLACAAVVLTPFLRVVAGARHTVEAAGLFLAGAVPVYGGLVVASGSPAAGTGYLTWAMGLANALPLAAEGFLFPLIQLFLVLAVAGAASETDLGGLAKSVYGAAKWLLVLGVTAFSGALSLQTLLGAQGDAAAGKTLKFLAASAVPVVGGALGDGLAALQSSVGVLRSGAGAFGILAALVLFVPTALETALWACLCGVGEIVGEWFGEKKLAGLLGLCRDGAKLLLGILTAIFTAVTVCAAIVLSMKGALT